MDQIKITEHKTGLKMSGFISINTSVLDNPYCQKNCKRPGFICRNCYGRTMEITYSNLRRNIKGNLEILKEPLSHEYLQDIVSRLKEKNRHMIRFHSIGELYNDQHYLNFLAIARAMPENMFAIWSKRKDIIVGYPELNNLNRIYSNPVINKPLNRYPAGFTGVFNVVTYDYAMEHNIKVNCTGNCAACRACYTPGKKVIITELLKSDQREIKKGRKPEITYDPSV